MKSVHQYLTERTVSSKTIELKPNEEFNQAVLKNDLNLAKQILKENPDIDLNAKLKSGSSLLHAVIDTKTMKFLLDNGIDINILNENNMTAFAYHAYYHREELMKLLLKYKANPNDKYDPDNKLNDNDSGMTALHFMCSYDKLEMAELLVKKGADVNARDDEGVTPLMICFNGKSLAKRCAKFLIDSGAKKNLKDVGGRTALTYAFSRTKDTKVLDMLS